MNLNQIHAEIAWGNFLAQYGSSPKLEAIVKALYAPADELQAALRGLYNDRWLDTALGAQLDGIGEIVGQPREIDDVLYVKFFGFLGQPNIGGFGGNTIIDITTPTVFDTDDGTRMLFTLPISVIDGEPVIYRSDWEGQQRLYPTPRTNRAWFSDDYTASNWAKSAVTVSGSPGAQLLLETATTAAHSITQNRVVNEPDLDSTFGWDILPAGRDAVTIATVTNSAWLTPGATTFNLVGAGSVTSGTGSVVLLPDGWYRVRMSGIFSSGGAINRGINLALRTVAGGPNSYLGDPTKGVYVRAASWETTGQPGGVIPVPGAANAVRTDYTRSNDQILLPAARGSVGQMLWTGKGVAGESNARLRREYEPNVSGSTKLLDTEYRKLLYWKIALNNGHGTAPEIAQAVKAIFDATVVRVKDMGNAKVGVWFNTTPETNPAMLVNPDRWVPKLAGVGVDLLTSPDEKTFGFITQGLFGFGEGILARGA